MVMASCQLRFIVMEEFLFKNMKRFIAIIMAFYIFIKFSDSK